MLTTTPIMIASMKNAMSRWTKASRPSLRAVSSWGLMGEGVPNMLAIAGGSVIVVPGGGAGAEEVGGSVGVGVAAAAGAPAAAAGGGAAGAAGPPPITGLGNGELEGVPPIEGIGRGALLVLKDASDAPQLAQKAASEEVTARQFGHCTSGTESSQARVCRNSLAAPRTGIWT